MKQGQQPGISAKQLNKLDSRWRSCSGDCLSITTCSGLVNIGYSTFVRYNYAHKLCAGV